MANKINMSNAKYQLIAGGMFAIGIGAGFLFSMGTEGTTPGYLVGGPLAIIGLILLIYSRFTK